jgi:hypothetical protein
MYHFHEHGFGWGQGVGVVGPLIPFLGLLFVVFLAWSLAWKGLALWHSAARSQPKWFIILLLVNTFGILEIIYLFFILKLKFSHLFDRHPHHHNH